MANNNEEVQGVEHISVLLKEAIEALNVRPGNLYVDCNLGGGGHTREILSLGGKVLAFDLDQRVIDRARQNFAQDIKTGNLKIFKSNFRNIAKVLKNENIENGQIAGILYDLGLSTFQLKEQQRGFSFLDDSLMDMRFDESLGVKAEDLLKVCTVDVLEKIIRDYGQEPQAKIFAKAIKDFVNQRIASGKNFTANEIGEVIKKASHYKVSKIHPATRVFQALRIAVSQELESLQESLHAAVPLLQPNGRLVIIAFHSLEDRIAKTLIEKAESPQLKTLNKKPVVPSQTEIEKNFSARSAKMRIYEKL